MTHVLAVIIGWFIGFVSNLLLQSINRINDMFDFVNGISYEFNICLSYLVKTKLLIDKKTGLINNSLLYWIIDVYKNIPANIISIELLEEVSRLLNLSQTELRSMYGNIIKENPSNLLSINLSTTKLNYSDLNFNKIFHFPSEMQMLFFIIIDKLKHINVEINNYNLYRKELNKSNIILLNNCLKSISMLVYEVSLIMIKLKELLNNYFSCGVNSYILRICRK